MKRTFDLSSERIVSIKNEILNDDNGNKLRMKDENNFPKALSKGADRLSGSYFKEVMRFLR